MPHHKHGYGSAGKNPAPHRMLQSRRRQQAMSQKTTFRGPRRLMLATLMTTFAMTVLAAMACSAFALPAGRVYEMVSPVFKGGLGATLITAVGQSGESVAYFSPGAFAGAQAGLGNTANPLSYMARRGTLGWTSESLLPPDGLLPYVQSGDSQVSLTLGSVLAIGKPGSTLETANLEGSELELLVRPVGSPGWEVFGGQSFKTLNGEPFSSYSSEGVSADLCHVLVGVEAPTNANDVLLEKAIGVHYPLYEFVRGCHGEAAEVKLVGLDSKGNPIGPECSVESGIGTSSELEQLNKFNAISADGSEVFFTACIKNILADEQLFVRLAGAKTLEVSRPLASSKACQEDEVPCKEAATRAVAEFAGASEDGSRVFFRTKAPLTGEVKDASPSLFMATIGCAESEPECAAAERRVTALVRVSRDPNGEEAAGVEKIVQVARDGSHAYFAATGDLLDATERSALEGEGRPVPHPGAKNLYAYDTVPGHEHVGFVGDLCSGRELSGSVEDPRCPNPTGRDTALWDSVGSPPRAQAAGVEGRYLVFQTYAQLTPDDTDTAADLYRYDTQTDELQRVSIGEGGHDANGDNSSFDVTMPEREYNGSTIANHDMSIRAVSEDGSRIVFATADPLSEYASNGLSNAYEWHESQGSGVSGVSLISTGSGESAVEDVVISGEGDDIFFDTAQNLAAQDTDGTADVYDARIKGGFSSPPVQPQQCSSDACQGPLTNPSPLLVPGSVSQAAGGNFATSKPAAALKAKRKPPAHAKKRRGKRKHKAKRAVRAHDKGKSVKRGG
jgi:hypothetical protein